MTSCVGPVRHERCGEITIPNKSEEFGDLGISHSAISDDGVPRKK